MSDTDRPRRILWLLNHKTLMPWEVPFLIENGYEVFTPKVIPPEREFRSGAVDYRWDSSLTLPASDLATLNAFDFYKSPWTEVIQRIVNEHFDCVFFIPFGLQPMEAITKFRGLLVLRAFGLLREMTYSQWLLAEFGTDIFEALWEVRGRFWFGPAYDNLSDVESQAIAGQTVYLPMGVPADMWAQADTWVGGSGKVLFLCPNIATVPEYRAQYTAFIEMIADIDYVVVGTQSEPIDDPRVLGFVDDDKLLELFQTCAVFYYPSDEPRHVHYAPVEAAIIGAPVLFDPNSLFGVLAGAPHASDTTVEAHLDVVETLRRAVSGESAAIEALRAKARTVSKGFTDDYCRRHWASFLGLFSYSDRTRDLSISGSSGRNTTTPSRHWMTVPTDLPLPEGDIAEGIDFRERTLPGCLAWYRGLSTNEAWGRWSEGPEVRLTLTTTLVGNVLFSIVGGAHGSNIGVPCDIQIGDEHVPGVTFGEGPWNATEHRIALSPRAPFRTIVLRVPDPIQVGDDPRWLGVGLRSLSIRPLLPVPADLAHGVDFTRLQGSDAIRSCSGLFPATSGDRWNSHARVAIHLTSPIAAPFELTIVSRCGLNRRRAVVAIEVNGQHAGRMTLRRSSGLTRHQLWISTPDMVDTIGLQLRTGGPRRQRSIGGAFALANLRIRHVPRRWSGFEQERTDRPARGLRLRARRVAGRIVRALRLEPSLRGLMDRRRKGGPDHGESAP